MKQYQEERVDVIIPVYHPDKSFFKLLLMLTKQTVQPECVYLLNTETGGEDDSAALREKIWKFFAGQKRFGKNLPLSVEIIPIKKEKFDHGGTRRRGAKAGNSPFMLFMTQDAVPADELLLEKLLKSMRQGVDVVYGRQLARAGAGVVESYTRMFNYPARSFVRTKEDIKTYGIKAFFCSNVCAMYRRSTYNEIGGFVQKTIFNEDMIYAGKLLRQGGSLAYCAEAKVYHSHDYSWGEQFQRNFDLGVSQAQFPQIFQQAASEKEGIRFVVKTLSFLWNQKYYLEAVDFIGESVCKYAGYLSGKMYRLLPKRAVLWCTQNKGYWEE